MRCHSFVQKHPATPNILQTCTLQALPFSVCTILRDSEVYNVLAPEQEEKRNAQRSRCNGRQINSWLQEVDDKWEKIKVCSLLCDQIVDTGLSFVRPGQHYVSWFIVSTRSSWLCLYVIYHTEYDRWKS